MFLRLSGFPVGHTIQRQTKGIWIWAQEHPVYSDRYLLLLDTEGLGDAEKVALYILYFNASQKAPNLPKLGSHQPNIRVYP